MAEIMNTVKRPFLKATVYESNINIFVSKNFKITLIVLKKITLNYWNVVEICANKPCQFDCKRYNSFFAKNFLTKLKKTRTSR